MNIKIRTHKTKRTTSCCQEREISEYDYNKTLYRKTNRNSKHQIHPLFEVTRIVWYIIYTSNPISQIKERKIFTLTMGKIKFRQLNTGNNKQTKKERRAFSFFVIIMNRFESLVFCYLHRWVLICFWPTKAHNSPIEICEKKLSPLLQLVSWWCRISLLFFL